MQNSDTFPQANPSPRIYTVAALNREARMMLEHGLPGVCVEGEISNLARPASGHWYFTLKDSSAQIRCAMFRQSNRVVKFAPKEGDKVIVRGKLTLYEARGDYQLVANGMEPAGEGALRREYEELRTKLESEGLFRTDKKALLPTWPSTIGVITSPSGAAIRDIVQVLNRRYPAAKVVIYPSSVQGESAPLELQAALHNAVERGECDVLVIGRGGGSLEDLWAFNNETLARQVAACPIPIVSAVGHETDFTICDFVADLRAPTPSAAAELVSPQTEDWLTWLTQVEGQLARSSERQLQVAGQRLDQLDKRLAQQHPTKRLHPYEQQIASLKQRLQTVVPNKLAGQHNQLSRLINRLHMQSPTRRFDLLKSRQGLLQQRLAQLGKQLTHASQQRLSTLSATLNLVSPLATLERGYAIATNQAGQAITSEKQARKGDAISIKLADGALDCRVE